MSRHDPLATYERIAEAMSRMASACEAPDWDAVARAQADCARWVECARREAVGELGAEDRARKARLIRAMLADDARVRRQAEPEMARLEQMLGGMRQAATAARAYDAASG